MRRAILVLFVLGFVCASLCQAASPSFTILGVEGTRVTVKGKPTSLLGISYYGAIGASDSVWQQDLREMKRFGFNWVRIWANWHSFGQEAFAVDPQGNAVPTGMDKLKAILAECDRLGIVVDITLSRGNGITGPKRLQNRETHCKAIQTLLHNLGDFRNWYLDLSNERNIQDSRFTSMDDLAFLRAEVKKLDPLRLVTASHAGDIPDDVLKEYVVRVRVDFISPHRPRNAASPSQTEAMTRGYLKKLEAMGRVVPVHYQEPFRRDFGSWNPRAEDFITDLQGAIRGGAAGWCFHNGDTRHAKDGRPRRSFDLREGSLFQQLDGEERSVLDWFLANASTILNH